MSCSCLVLGLWIQFLALTSFMASAHVLGNSTPVRTTCNYKFNVEEPPGPILWPLEFIPGTGYAVHVDVGGQVLKLLLTTTINGIVLFQDGLGVCRVPESAHCYIPENSSTAIWCNNSDVCEAGKVTYKCNETTNPHGINPITATIFRVDGVHVILQTIEGYEHVKLLGEKSDVKFEFVKAPVKLAQNIKADSDVQYFKNVHGLFGIANGDLGCRNYSIWSKMIDPFDGIYSLRIENEGKDSRIKLGTSSPDYHALVWSEHVQSGGIYNNSLLEFSLYHMEVCGAPVFGRTSCYWEAIIDATSEHLVLPKNFWTTLMLHLPIDRSCMASDAKSRLCKVLDDVKGPLPEIKFYLSDQEPKLPVHMPLDLLVFEKDGTRYLAIVPDENKTERKGFSFVPTIKFGYRVLRLYTVLVDTKRKRIGFSYPLEYTGSNDTCTPKIACKGDQVYEPSLNFCMDPFCSVWLFKRLNPTTGSCEISPLAVGLFTIALAVLVSIEIYCLVARRQIFKCAKTRSQ